MRVVCGVWCVVWCAAYGVWCVVCGVWCVVCGVWCVVCGVWCVMRADAVALQLESIALADYGANAFDDTNLFSCDQGRRAFPNQQRIFVCGSLISPSGGLFAPI